MPASRSPNRDPKPSLRARTPPAGRSGNGVAARGSPGQRPGSGAVGRRWYWPIGLIAVGAVLAVVIALLPASIVAHFLPPAVHAEDFSGSIWHGSAGRVIVNARDAGALEWRLHPWSLLEMTVAADLHWVKVGFVIDGTVRIRHGDFAAQDVRGGGPIQDLADIGVAPGWRGRADVDLRELRGDFVNLLAATGDVRVSNLSSPQVADGTDLGGYDLQFPVSAVGAGGDVAAQLSDTGGPLEVQAVIRYAAKERTATLSGTLRERPAAPAALRSQIDNLSQLRGRDPQGRVPLDFELTL